MSCFQRGLGKQDAIVPNDSDWVTMDVCETLHECKLGSYVILPLECEYLLLRLWDHTLS